MARSTHVRLLLAALLLLCLTTLPMVHAQDTKTSSSSSSSNNKQTSSSSNAATSSSSSGTSSSSGKGATTGTGSSSAATPTVALSSAATTNMPAQSTTTVASVQGLTGAPTLQGVGIPTLIVPYTANAPFMKKSTLPEGTVFITVGAVLAFLGFCVIGWRALVAWSINRSVKRAALASIMASETKNPGGWANNPFKPAGGFYSQAPGGSTLSLNDHPTSKRGAPFRNPVPSNASGLFFSPTASNTGANTNIPMTGMNHTGNRASSLLPAGYYASPSSQVAGGAPQTSIGGTGQPYMDSPNLQARRHTSTQPMPSLNLAPPASRESRRLSSRPTSAVPPQGLHPQGSAGSLQVGTGHADDLPGSRAPSAYLEDLFEGHHGTPPPVPHQR